MSSSGTILERNSRYKSTLVNLKLDGIIFGDMDHVAASISYKTIGDTYGSVWDFHSNRARLSKASGIGPDDPPISDEDMIAFGLISGQIMGCCWSEERLESAVSKYCAKHGTRIRTYDGFAGSSRTFQR